MTDAGRTSRVESLIGLHRYAEALERAEALLAETPDDVDLLGLRAQALLGLDRDREALQAGNQLVALAPDLEWGHRICSLALSRLDLHADAMRAAAEAVRLAPHAWQTHARYAGAAAAQPRTMREAEAAAVRAVQLGPHEASVHVLLARIAAAQRRWDAAREGFRRALQIDPQHPDALTGMAQLDSQRHLVRRARDYAGVLSETPDHSGARESIEQLAFRFVRRLYWAGLAGLLLGLAIGAGSGELGEVNLGTVVVGAVLALAIAAYVAWLLRAIPRGVSRYVRQRVVQDRLLLVTTVLTVVMLLTALAVCFVPRGGVVAVVLLRPLGWVNIAVLVWGVVRAQRT